MEQQIPKHMKAKQVRGGRLQTEVGWAHSHLLLPGPAHLQQSCPSSRTWISKGTQQDVGMVGPCNAGECAAGSGHHHPKCAGSPSSCSACASCALRLRPVSLHMLRI